MKSIKNKFVYENGFFYEVAENYWNIELPLVQMKVGMRHRSFEFTSRELLQHIRISAGRITGRIREKLYETNQR